MASGRSRLSSDGVVTLLGLGPGGCGVVVGIVADSDARAGRLEAMGVTPGALVTVLQVMPGVIFRCDETELAVEPAVASRILVAPLA